MENFNGLIGAALIQRETSLTSTSCLEDQNVREITTRCSSSSASSVQGSGSGTESRSGGHGSDGGSSSGHGFGEIYSQNERAYFEEGGLSPTLRSLSLASISSEGSTDSNLVDHEDIVTLSASVRAFKEALGKLRKIFGNGKDKNEVLRVIAHERLGEVLKILRNILENYSAIQHNELLSAASKLITQVNGFQYDTEESDPSEFLEAIDHLALAFSTRVSEYLMGDIDNSSAQLKCSSSTASSKTKSCEILLCSDDESVSGITFSNSLSMGLPEMSSNNSNISSIDKEYDAAPADEVDEILQQHEKGVELALHQAKIWSKYANDLLIYVQKKSQLTIDFTKKQAKLALAVKSILKEENFMSFQDVMCSSLDQEIEFSNMLSSTFLLIQSSKFIEPLNFQRNEHEKSRKELKELWNRQLKKLVESVNSLKRAKIVYIQCSQEALKFGETLQKNATEELSENIEKKREDFSFKVREAAGIYSAAVREANDQYTALQFVKKEVLKNIKELLLQADSTMKQVISTYFEMQQSLVSSLSVQLQTNLDLAKRYEPGTEYIELVRRFLPIVSDDPIPTMNPFEFEQFSATESNLLPNTDYFQILSFQSGSDTDSITSSRSGKSTEASPTSSPHSGIRRFVINLSSGDELEGDMDGDMSFSSEIQVLSKAADTHTFRKLKTPSRCRECDSYVYFHGFECAECGLGCHKKCLETLTIQCGHRRLPRKLTTFGVDLLQHLQETNAQIPHLVTKCLSEIDARGTTIKGIYRVSGLKSRVEKLCQAFENGSHLVDITDQHPNVIANVLKLYLRQLPEPLLTFRLYSDFIKTVKEFPGNYYNEACATVIQIKELLKRLPSHHYLCLTALMLHLNRVAANAQINNMPPSNLDDFGRSSKLLLGRQRSFAIPGPSPPVKT